MRIGLSVCNITTHCGSCSLLGSATCWSSGSTSKRNRFIVADGRGPQPCLVGKVECMARFWLDSKNTEAWLQLVGRAGGSEGIDPQGFRLATEAGTKKPRRIPPGREWGPERRALWRAMAHLLTKCAAGGLVTGSWRRFARWASRNESTCFKKRFRARARVLSPLPLETPGGDRNLRSWGRSTKL